MAISNYSDLKTAVANWSGRTSLTDRIPEFVQLLEEKIVNGSYNAIVGQESPPLRSRHIERVSTLTLTSGIQTVNIPAGTIAASERAYIDSSPDCPLITVPFSQLVEMYSTDQTGKPKYMAIKGSKIYFGAIPDDNYSVIFPNYYLTSILTDEDNEVITHYPSIYLYGCLVELYLFIRAPEKAAEYFSLFAGAVRSANNAYGAFKVSAGGGRVSTTGYKP